jgi:hypothetical protein
MGRKTLNSIWGNVPFGGHPRRTCMPILALLSFLVAGAPGRVEAQTKPDWADTLPFPFPLDATYYGEVNGLPLFAASGYIDKNPESALKAMELAFPEKNGEKEHPTLSSLAPQGKQAIFWQAYDLVIPAPEDLKQVMQDMPELGVRMALRLTMIPLMIDVSCQLNSMLGNPSIPGCGGYDADKVMLSVSKIIPQSLWHSAVFVRSDKDPSRSRYHWLVMRPVAPERMFGLKHAENRKVLCKDSPLPLPEGTECLIVAHFIFKDRAVRLVVAHAHADAEAVRGPTLRRLQDRGWRETELLDGQMASLSESSRREPAELAAGILPESIKIMTLPMPNGREQTLLLSVSGSDNESPQRTDLFLLQIEGFDAI